jgi:3-hydroxybutyrate dehydrogenase
MPDVLRTRSALVTGGASGIGRAIALALAADGARILVSDLDEPGAQRVAEQIRSFGGEAKAHRCDVASEPDVKQCVAEAVATFGGLDILVNNAGIQHVALIEEFPTEIFERMLRIMLIGPFLGMKYAIPIMKSRGWGRIISLGSINALVGFAGKSAYNSAKHGVIGLTRVAALELATSGITVNAICPSYVDTPLVRNQLRDLARTRGVPEERVLEEVIYPLVPQRRLLSPEEVADYVVFLASEKAKGVTGQAVLLDGGYTAQ